MKQTHHIGYVQTPSVKNLSNVKNALVENGLVPLTTPNEMLPDAIEKGLENLKPENIRSSVEIGNVKGVYIGETPTLDKLDLESCIVTPFFDHVFYASNGVDAYGSYSDSSKTGIYHINLNTQQVTKIYNSGYYWSYFYEDIRGNIYASSYYTVGLLHLEGLSVRLIHEDGKSWRNFFEDSKGNLYTSSTNDGNGVKTGILYLSGGSAAQLYNKNADWRFIENPQGGVYAYYFGTYTGVVSGYGGVLYINGLEKSIVLDNAKGVHLFVSKTGNVYMSSHDYGILLIQGTTINEIYSADNGKYWMEWFESSNGNIYVSGTNNGSSSNGLLMISGAQVTKIRDTGRWNQWFEDSKGNVYAGVIYDDYGEAGYIKIVNGIVTKVYDTSEAYGTTYWFEASDGTIYVSSKDLTLHIKDDVGYQVGTSSDYLTGMKLWFEDSNGTIYITKNATSNGVYIWCINDTNATKIVKTPSYYNPTFREVEKGVLVSGSSYVNPESTVYLLNGTNYSTVKIKEE